MGRKNKLVTIIAEGRDHGKIFRILEMSADQGERWALRAFGAMSRAGVDIPEHVLLSGYAGLSALGLKAFLAADWEDVEPLLAEMMACVRAEDKDAPTDKATGEPINRPLVDTDIEEVATRIKLRDEVFELHTGFSVAASLFTAIAAILNRPDGENTPTSPDESAS